MRRSGCRVPHSFVSGRKTRFHPQPHLGLARPYETNQQGTAPDFAAPPRWAEWQAGSAHRSTASSASRQPLRSCRSRHIQPYGKRWSLPRREHFGPGLGFDQFDRGQVIHPKSTFAKTDGENGRTGVPIRVAFHRYILPGTVVVVAIVTRRSVVRFPNEDVPFPTKRPQNQICHGQESAQSDGYPSNHIFSPHSGQTPLTLPVRL